ncbi:MAG: hypothetical protein HY220_04075 [Candidatus Sungbacteria bacterium]|uniref:Thioredoxin-like fold domain-containing protein n=1 Tax=Candidatus Sungiibacteriota bacterium TaxID=2750080 RepID=A0A9D6LTM9_9BACT|nr:hypothetical protein [Candidatus Sungbacteria bacterium]
MSSEVYRMQHIALEELSSPGCSHCQAFEAFWHSIEKDWPAVTYKNTSVITPEGQALAQKHMIFASPGILLNGELWATGGFDKTKFLARLKELSGE